MRVLLLTVLVVSFGSSVVQGGLILQINTIDKTFAFTGDATGTPHSAGGIGFMVWQLTGIGGSAAFPNGVSYDNDVAFSTSVGTPGGLGLDTSFGFNNGAGVFLNIELHTSSASNQTLTGLGAFQSYASLSASSQALFESQIGESASLITGTGFGSMSVQSAAVPEPSTFSIMSLGMLGMAGYGWRRRRKAT